MKWWKRCDIEDEELYERGRNWRRENEGQRKGCCNENKPKIACWVLWNELRLLLNWLINSSWLWDFEKAEYDIDKARGKQEGWTN